MVSASPLSLAEKYNTLLLGLPIVKSYSLSRVTEVILNLFTYHYRYNYSYNQLDFSINISFYKKFQKERLFKSNLIHNILFWGLLLSCILYFSRTMIVMTIITLLTIYGYTIITTTTIRIGLVLLGCKSPKLSSSTTPSGNSMLYKLYFKVSLKRIIKIYPDSS